MFMMFFRVLFFCLLTVTNVAAAPHQLPKSAITCRSAQDSGMTDITSIAGTLNGDGNGGGNNANNDTPGEDGNDNGHNGNGDLSGNTIIVGRTFDASAALAGVTDMDGNGNGGNGNGNTDGENGHNNGMNGDGDESGNTIIIPRTFDASAVLTGVLNGDGNGNGGNGNDDTNGEDGNNNGKNLNGDLSGNTVIVRRTFDASTTLAGVENGDGNGNGGNGNGNTNGENGNGNGGNGNGDLSGNTIIVGRTFDASAALAGVADMDGNGNGGNGNGDTNGKNGDNNGMNGNGDLSGNTITPPPPSPWR